MDAILQFKVANQEIERINKFVVVEGSNNYLQAQFTFATPDWENMIKTGVFIDEDGDVHTSLCTNDTCDVPSAWLKEQKGAVGVIGSDGTTRITTAAVTVRIKPKGYTGDGGMEEESKAYFDQIMQAFTETKEFATAEANRAQAAANTAGKFAEQTGKDAAQTAADRTAVTELAETVSSTGETVQADKEQVALLKEQAQTATSNALLSEQSAKTSESAAAQSAASAEAAADQAEQYAAQTKEDKNTVEQAKTIILQQGEEIEENKASVEQMADAFNLTHQAAVTDVKSAGQLQVERAQETGKNAVESITAEKTQAVSEINTAGSAQVTAIEETSTAQITAITEEGTAQVANVQAAAAEIAADRDQIAANQQAILNTTIPRAASGKNILVTDSAKVPFRGLRTYGRTTQETTTGAQLLNPDLYKLRTINGITFTKDDYGRVIVSGEATGVATLYLGEYIDLLEDGNVYNFSGGSNFQIIHIDGTASYKTSLTVDKENMTSITPYIQSITGDVADNIIYEPILNVGSTALPWEPYTGGIPSPNPEYPQELVSAGDKGNVNIDVSVGGRNLLLQSATKKISAFSGTTLSLETGVGVSEWGATDAIRVYGTGGTNVTFATLAGVSTPSSVSVDGENYVHSIYIKNNGSQTLTITNNSIGKAKTVQPGEITRTVIHGVGNGFNNLHFNFRTPVAGDAFDFVYWHPKIEIGTEATDWTPAPEDNGWLLSFSTPNGLHGIPVTSGGNYTDENGQQWICDEIDLGRGVYIQKVQLYALTSDRPWGIYDSGFYVRNGLQNVAYNERIYTLCSHFAHGTKEALPYFKWTSTGNSISPIFHNTEFETIEEWKAWLDENGLKILYIIAEPIETPIPPEELAAYQALHTNMPTTTIYNDEDVWMEVEYVADPENYISQNYVPKESYNALEQRVAALEANILNNI